MQKIDKVFIKNYIINAKHGYYKEEHYKPQRFVISVICGVGQNHSGASDDLKETFNYEIIRNIIDEVVRGESKKLLEYLSEKIAEKILIHNIVKSVEVEMHKPDIWGDCNPGVNIVRGK
jgi:dihydroneopterin aldolase